MTSKSHRGCWLVTKFYQQRGTVARANPNFAPNQHPSNTVFANVNVTNSSSPGYYLHSRTTTTPGLLANGSPTSNASLSVGIDSIDEDDDYGYIHNFEEWFSANTSA